MSACCQQDALYRSEETVPRGAELDLAGARELVDRLRDLDWWNTNVPEVRFIEVEPSFSLAGGSVGGWEPERGCGVIEMHKDHLCELFICHELAHVLAEARWGSKAHCPAFARMYLTVVWMAMGSDAYLALYDAFVRDGIDFA